MAAQRRVLRSRSARAGAGPSPFESLGFARLDTRRLARRGLPEIIFSEGKTAAHLTGIVRRLAAVRAPILLSRLDAGLVPTLRAIAPRLRYEPLARMAYVPRPGRVLAKGLVAIVTGGTSDLPVAEEAAVTLRYLGSRVAKLYDVGVAGVHRVLHHVGLLRRARVVLVAAGMDGALPSVIAGLVPGPVVAVPTSVGYGASFEGIAPLLTMLNTCAPGIGVVNIDNGVGAACLAHLINARSSG